jgi:ketosteroid isomerase-like protein
MPAMSPEEICLLFQKYMGEGDLESVLSVYDPDAVFLNQSRDVTKNREDLRRELAPLVARKARFDFTIKQVVQADDIALMHTAWSVSGPQPMKVHAIEVARRQQDGTWRWLIGDPFTVGREVGDRDAGTPA